MTEPPGTQGRDDGWAKGGPRRDRARRAVLGLWGYYLLVMLLPMAGPQALLFRRQGVPAVERFVFALYVFGHMPWVNLTNALLGVTPFSPAGVVVQLVQPAFLVLALRGFHRVGLARAAAGGLALYAAYMATAARMGFATCTTLRLL